ncbi:hydroxymethylpyrimidine/phosphomethylpyrimidine kinase [Undibacterium piscinae]|uniref:hydroxymethylpyrimidine kinase n=1 Tax=Undibacterium piscinae TaxID=2495591 RepID=A0A6M4A7H7_9BURK|nr:hydroxymethylpyrimidine/phosphomethylpyrimidine kinase [Undibacterium piscinae]
MQNQTTPLILTFGASNPVTAIGIQADLSSFAAMGCHGVPVLTTILVGDTTQIDDTHPLDADLVSDQARTVLEDMEIIAIKVGQVGSVENITVIAEIVSDYPEMPMILDPFDSSVPEPESEAEDILLAIRELLIPQATLLLISAVELTRLAESWSESVIPTTPAKQDDMAADVMTLIESGCEYVLVTGVAGQGNDIENILFNDEGIVRRDLWQRVPGTYMGAGNTLSAAITAVLANGMDMADAVHEAQEFTLASINHAQRLGMGKLIPDHYFWAKEPE